MSDEACNTYSAIITSMTSGHKYIKNNFSPAFYPKIGWSIDPFGASSAVNRLYKLMGFNATVIQRIPDNVKKDRKAKKELEFWWKQNENVGDEYQFLTHIMSENYCEFKFFDTSQWGWGPTGPDNLENRVNLAIQAINQRSYGYSTNDFLLPLGCDFTFRNDYDMAMLNSLPAVLEEIRRYYKIDIKFTLLSDYFSQLKLSKNITYQSDFNPYSDNPYDFWTGFYTSYPVLKSRIRQTESYFRNANFLLTTVFLKDLEGHFDYVENLKLMAQLEKSVSDTTHHDAITGTSKKRVNDECYFPILDQGIENGKLIIKRSLEFLINGTLTFNVKEVLKSLKPGEIYELVFYNSLSWPRDDYITLTLNNSEICLFNEENMPIPIQKNINRFPDVETVVEYELHFQIEIPSMGHSKLLVKMCESDFIPFQSKNESFEISTNFFNYTFSAERLTSMYDKERKKMIPISQDFIYYKVNGGGKYIFQPTNEPPISIKNTVVGVENSVVVGPLLTIIHQRFEFFCQQIIKIYHNKKYIEFDMKIGHPFGILPDTEVATKFRHSKIQNKKLYADSNGLETHERVPDQKVEASYFPLVYSAFIKDEQLDDQVTIVSGHTHGIAGGLRESGTFEIMLARRVLSDDGRGVDEPLSDLDITRSKFRLFVGSIESSVEARHKLAYELNFPTTVLLSKSATKKVDSLTSSLPKNLHVLSFDMINNQSFIVRLQNLYQKNEGASFKDFSFSTFFKNATVFPMSERTLSLMHFISKFTLNQEIELKPMDIRTFVISKYNITEDDIVEPIPMPSPTPSPIPSPRHSPNPIIPPSTNRNETLLVPNFGIQFIFSFGLLFVVITVVGLLTVALVFKYVKKFVDRMSGQ